MERNIIVQEYIIKINGERLNLYFTNRKSYNFCNWSPTTNATFENGKQAMEILQRDGRNKSSARMSRQNLQYRNRNRRRIWKPFSVTLALSWRARQAPRPHHDKIQIRTNKDDCNDAKVCALYDNTIEIFGREPLLIFGRDSHVAPPYTNMGEAPLRHIFTWPLSWWWLPRRHTPWAT